jgi:hypothetical protein
MAFRLLLLPHSDMCVCSAQCPASWPSETSTRMHEACAALQVGAGVGVTNSPQWLPYPGMQ